MTTAMRHEPFLRVMDRFLHHAQAAADFCDQFTRLWVENRDRTLAKKATWSQPYDEMLLAAFQRGEISTDEFQNEYAKLWGYADDIEFQTMIDALHSACMCWDPSPELDWEIDDEQLRQEVGDALAAYQNLSKPLAHSV